MTDDRDLEAEAERLAREIAEEVDNRNGTRLHQTLTNWIPPMILAALRRERERVEAE